MEPESFESTNPRDLAHRIDGRRGRRSDCRNYRERPDACLPVGSDSRCERIGAHPQLIIGGDAIHACVAKTKRRHSLVHARVCFLGAVNPQPRQIPTREAELSDLQVCGGFSRGRKRVHGAGRSRIGYLGEQGIRQTEQSPEVVGGGSLQLGPTRTGFP